MPGCAAVGCTNRTDKGFLMKCFPRDPQQRAVWAAEVKRLNWQPTNTSFLCEVHFEADQWEKTRVDGSRKLKFNAVPTLFKHVIKTKLKRKQLVNQLPIPVKTKKIEISLEHEVSANEEIVSLPEISVTPCHTDREKDSLIKERNETVERLYKQAVTNNKQVHSLKKKATSNTIQKHNDKEKDYLKVCETIGNEDQILSLDRKNTRFTKWSNETINDALGLKFSCGQSGYENSLRLNLPYPSLRTLRRRMEKPKFQSSILTEVFDFMRIKVSAMKHDHEKECVLLLDEMSRTESIDYDTSTNSCTGSVTVPKRNGQANRALVFMLVGIATRWKQTVAYYYTGSSVDQAVLKNMILDVIKSAENLGLKINSITSDMSAVNQTMWKSFNVNCTQHGLLSSCSIIHPNDPTRTINFLAEVPHSFKNIETSLLSL